ncbi:MAG: NAD(P)-dependent oxidoreductase [bacterium]|nr:NAD(P)-dependent oxidoreductase [bacterium]MCP4799980.1 NAD(P)-dependent oxidoreductase [bacterium]
MSTPPADNKLDTIIVTGASGFIGSYLLNTLKNNYSIIAIARRSQNAARIPYHPNIHWMRVDIGNEEEVKQALESIGPNSVDFLFHLAGFFDFEGVDHPEYEHTNVNGTEYILKYSKCLNLKRFIFASSLTVSKFTKPGTVIDENSPADATVPYAVSKIKGEKMVEEFSSFFPTTIVRLAAIFSDWCQYSPLHAFLTKWLSDDWDHKFIVGKGETAIPYFHISNLMRFFMSLISKTERLPQYSLLIASSVGCTSHNELFTMAMRYNRFKKIEPTSCPKWVARIGVIQRNLWGGIKHAKPFERYWMLRYIDTRMVINPEKTRTLMGCSPNPRYHILRRLPFLIANLKRVPHEWHHLNQHFPYDQVQEKENLKIYRTMLKMKNSIVDEISDVLQLDENAEKFKTYQSLTPGTLRIRVNLLYSFLEKDILMGNRSNVLDYAHTLALDRFKEGFSLNEVCDAVQTTADVVMKMLLAQPELRFTEQRIQSEVLMTLQMAIDEITDTYENYFDQDNLCFEELDDTYTVCDDPWQAEKKDSN